MKTIHNPNPIKLNATEQKAIDQIKKNLLDLIFSKKWERYTKVNNALVFDETVMVTKFGEKPRPIRIIVKGRKKASNSHREVGFGFTNGVFSTWRDTNTGKITREQLEVDLNGHAYKNSFSKMYKQDPFRFFVEFTDFLATIRHELIHAKDPIKDAGYGTLSIDKRYGHLHYVNDPARVEIRSAMGEWDILFSEIENIIKNKDKDEYHKEVYEAIKEYLCDFQSYFPEVEDKAQALFDFLSSGLGSAFVPKDLAKRLKKYHEFWSISDQEAKKTARAYERALKTQWKLDYEEKFKVWRELESMRSNEFRRSKMPKKLTDNYRKAKNEANRIAKEKFRKKYPNVSLKKPKLKTKFTKKEFQNILDNRQKNYQEAIQTIYTLMKNKGLLDKSLCSDKKTASEIARERRAMVLLKREKIVINALLSRFEDINL